MNSHRPFSSNAFKNNKLPKRKFIMKVFNDKLPNMNNTFTRPRPKTTLRLLKEKSDIFSKGNENLNLLNLMIKSSPNQYNPKKINKKKIIINPLYIRGTEENLKRPNFNENTEKVFYKYNLLYGSDSNNLIRTYSPKMRPMSSSINEFNKKMAYENSKNVFVFDEEEIMQIIKARCKDLGIKLRENMVFKLKNFINSKCRNRCVDLRDFYLGIHSIQIISHYIFKVDRIAKLNLTRNNLGDQGIEILISAVKNSMSLISLDITSNNISYKGGQFIFKNLSEQQSLIDLNISSLEGTNRNRLTNSGLKYIDLFFNKNKYIETLNLSGNSLKDEGLVLICQSINDNKNLQNLNISNNEIGSTGLIQGLTFINLCKLISFNLSNNQLLDSGIKALSNSLQFFPNLRELNISNCGFEFKGFEYLIKSLTLYKNIWTLNISGNVIKDKNFENIKTYFESLTIRNLNMSKCLLGNEASLILGDCIANNESIKKLNISCNKISDEGFRNFASLFSSNSTIESFDCSQNLITDKSAMKLVKGLKYNHTLKKINFFDNQVTNNTGNLFLEILHSNKTLRSVNLLLNRVQLRIMEEINKRLKSNVDKEKAKYVPDLYKTIKNLKFNPEAFKFYEKNIKNKKTMQVDLYKRVKKDDKFFTRLINIENKKIDIKINKKLNIESEITKTQNEIKNILQDFSQLQDEIFEQEKEIEKKIEAEKKIYKKYKDENDLLKIEYNATKKSFDDIIEETIIKQKKSKDKLSIAEIAVNTRLKEISKKRDLLAKLYDPEFLIPIKDNNENSINQVDNAKDKIKKLSGSILKKSTFNYTSSLNVNNMISEVNNTGLSTSTNENLLTTTSGNINFNKKESIKRSILKKSINKKK